MKDQQQAQGKGECHLEAVGEQIVFLLFHAAIVLEGMRLSENETLGDGPPGVKRSYLL